MSKTPTLKKEASILGYQTPSSFSKTQLASIDKLSSNKKKKSTVKSIVYQFGELVAIWINDVSQLELLIASIVSLFQNISSINQSFLFPLSSSWITHINNEQFSDLHHRLITVLFSEITAAWSQTKIFMYVQLNYF